MSTPPRHVPLFYRIYDLLVWWHVHTKRFPKSERYTIATRMFELLLEALIGIMKSEFSQQIEKLNQLERTVTPNINAAKILVRLAHSLELISEQKYIQVECELNEIGKMLGAWIRNIQQAKSPH